MMRPLTSLEDVYAYLAEQIAKKVQVLLRTLTYIGKECVKMHEPTRVTSTKPAI